MSASSSIVAGAVAFVATNIDDALLLLGFFADTTLRRRSIVIGQFLGIALITAASALGALSLLVLPLRFFPLLGIIPLALGVKKLQVLHAAATAKSGNHAPINAHDLKSPATSSVASQIATVASVTIASGGDNLAAYIPLFGANPESIGTYAATFAVMTGLLCVAAYGLVSNSVVGVALRKVGSLMLPIALMLIGIYILCGLWRQNN